jgi:predicted nucleic acid-binding protein
MLRRAKDRDRLQTQLIQELSQIGRSQTYEEQVRGTGELVALLGKVGEESKARLESTLSRVLAAGELVHINAQLYADSLRLQSERSLGPQDAIIYASVLRHLRTAPHGPKCFLNKNAKDFLVPDVESDLAGYDCRVIPSFTNGLGFIQARL